MFIYAVVAIKKPQMYDYLSFWCWTLFCVSHYTTARLEYYTQSAVRLLMADLSQYAIILLFVLNSRFWFIEAIFFLSLYFGVAMAMAFNA